MEDKVRTKNLESLFAFFEKFGREQSHIGIRIYDDRPRITILYVTSMRKPGIKELYLCRQLKDFFIFLPTASYPVQQVHIRCVSTGLYVLAR